MRKVIDQWTVAFILRFFSGQLGKQMNVNNETGLTHGSREHTTHRTKPNELGTHRR